MPDLRIGRRACAAAAGCAVAAALAAPVQAQALPELEIASDGEAVTVTGAKRAQATRISFVARGERPTVLELFRLDRGVSYAEFEAAVASLRGPPDPLQELGSFVSGTFATPGDPTAIRNRLRAGRYEAIDVAARSPITTRFRVQRVEDPRELPRPDERVVMRDFSFSSLGSVAHDAVLRFVHAGARLHEVLALGVGKGTTPRRVERRLRAGKSPGKNVRVVPLLALVSTGSRNDVELDLKRGRYVLACFYGSPESNNHQHSDLGMVERFRVR